MLKITSLCLVLLALGKSPSLMALIPPIQTVDWSMPHVGSAVVLVSAQNLRNNVNRAPRKYRTIIQNSKNNW